MSRVQKGDPLTEARAGDAVEKCRRGRVAVLPFLSPYEQKRAGRALCAEGMQENAWFFGGYPEAERACLFLLPDYLCALLEQTPACSATEEVQALIGEELESAVCALRIRGSGYRTLTHRDYLGSILGLGVERDVIGDIAVQSEHEAILFCTRSMAEFLIGSLTKVASDTVRCAFCILDESFTDGRRYAPISDTVASPRLDCVVAALTNLSREEAQRAVTGGLVEVDFEPVERVDLLLSPPATVSVRGFGRYILRTFDGETKKGRLRLRADRLI